MKTIVASDVWDYFSHDQSRSRAYHWGEDGLGRVSDSRQLLCFAIGTTAAGAFTLQIPDRNSRGIRPTLTLFQSERERLRTQIVREQLTGDGDRQTEGIAGHSTAIGPRELESV